MSRNNLKKSKMSLICEHLKPDMGLLNYIPGCYLSINVFLLEK